MPPDRQPSQSRAVRKPSSIISLGRVILLFALTATVSPLSQLTLAPSFGQISSSVNHATMICLTLALGVCLHESLEKPNAILRYLAVWSFWIPVVQWLLSNYNGKLGTVGGPIVQGISSCHAMLIPSAYSVAEALDNLNLKSGFGRRIYLLHKIAGVVALCALPDHVMKRYLTSVLTATTLLSPVHLQLILATSYTILAPSWLLLLALPALFHTLIVNPHISTSAVNSAIQPHNWHIVDRQWSNTGYISILENLDERYRVMRCDHSLLGGEWLLTPERRDREGWSVEEPVFAVFEMLEAVRLIKVDPPIVDEEAHALIVGLGIGTAPKAFLSHGIDVTVVELDPIVHKFAGLYFGLPSNHTAVLQDATTWVGDAATTGTVKYDYILHDVFTGGAEPLALFTTEFLSNLRKLLAPNGVIAINYAGDLALPLTSLVLRTIDGVFDGQCKIFGDSPPEAAGAERDFLNMVVFCRNPPGPIAFRKPTPADFLGSRSREHYMLPKAEYEIAFPSRDADHIERGAPYLDAAGVRAWDGEQVESAWRHWRIMREVVPDVVWDTW